MVNIFSALFAKVEANEIEELEAHIDSLNKELKAEDKLIQEQVKFTKNYNEKKENLEKVEAEIVKLSEEKQAAVAASQEISTVGVQKLQVNTLL